MLVSNNSCIFAKIFKTKGMAKEKELEQVEGQQLSVENKVESLIRVTEENK